MMLRETGVILAVMPILTEFGTVAVLVVHLAWAVWMVVGVLLGVAGYWWPRFWGWRSFRTGHLVGLLLTATVPLWNQGICPLTNWEWALDTDRIPSGTPESLVVRLIRAVLYIDVSPTVIGLATAMGAMVTLWIYINHPPWRDHGRFAGHSPPG
jgi:hypothetical protein